MFSYFGGRASFEEGAEERESALSSYDYDDEEFEMLVKAFMQDINYTTVNQAAMNIACSMINAGLVALPFVAQEAGIPLFFFSMLILSIISAYTSVMVVSMANERRVRTLEDLAECAFGIRGFFVVSVLQLLFSLSLMIITLNVWADIMSDVFRRSDIHANFLHKRHYQIYLGAGIILPLCILKKSLSTLRWTSFITILAMAGAFIAVIATYVSDQEMSGNYSDTTFQELCRPKGYWWAIVFISVYSFSSNQKVLTIYSSLRRRTSSRWQIAMGRSLTVIFILYTLFGICGYIAKDQRDLRIDGFNFFLSDQHEKHVVFDPARSMVAFSLLLTLPVDSLVAATTWRRLWAKLIKRRQQSQNAGHDPHDMELTCCAVFCAAPPFHSIASEDHHENEEDEEAGDRKQGDVNNEMHYSNDAAPAPSTLPQSPTTPKRKAYHRQRSRQSRAYLSQALQQSHQQGDSSSSSSLLSGIYSTIFSSAKKSFSSTVEHQYSPVTQDDTSRNTPEADSGPSTEETDRTTFKSNYSYRSYDHSRSRDSSLDDDHRPHKNFNVAQSPLKSLSSDGKNGRTNNSTVEDNINANNGNLSNGSNSNNTSSLASRVHSAILLPKEDDEEEDLANNPHLQQILHRSRPAGTSTAEALYDQYNMLLEVTSPLPEREQVVPTLLLWLFTIVISLFVKDWTYLAGSLGTLSTVLLLFIIPALLYQRLRLVSDYESIPLYGAILPNHVYMSVLLVIGVLILFFDILVDGYFFASGQRMFDP
jgi:hypothetical protein